MASFSSPPPSPMAIPPTSSPPPPSSSQPPIAQPNATSDPPTSSNSPPSIPNSPPPSFSTPNTPPPTPNDPPPPSFSTPNTPPPTPNDPPPPTPNDPPPPPPNDPPPPIPNDPLPPTPPTSPLTPPPQSPPPTPIPTPPSATSPPPPVPVSTPPSQSPPALPPPTSPTKSPPSIPPPPTSPPLATPQPPASMTPEPEISPPSPISVSPPKSQGPPSNSFSPPPKNQSPTVPLPPSSSPNDSINSSTSGPNVTAGVNKSNGGGGGGTKIATPVAIVTSLLVLSLMVLAVWYFKKRKKRNGEYSAGFVSPSPFTSSQVSGTSYPQSPSAPLVFPSSGSQNLMYKSQPDPSFGSSKTCFNYEELYNVTNGFSDKNLLGEGGFGCVYKGCLSDGREVAVKQLKVGGSQGEREFRAEVEIIGRVHHRHLVSLVGYCIADTERLLVYDFVPNDTLHHHLHGEGRLVMKWEVRLKVATGAARGIAYLHEDCHPRIIHRDIKSSNILLDNEYEAQVSDFGLARLAMDAATHVTTRVMGTFGYLAPEYASSGKLTERSDVYSFGVVLLEIITGRKPVDTSQPIGDESLVEWARPQLIHALETSEFGSLIDPRLETNYNGNEMYRMIETAAACIRHSAPMRPRMGLVARALEGLADIDLSNGVKPGQSELYSAKSAEIRLFQRMAFGNQNYSSDFSNFSNFSGKSQRD